MKQKFKNRALLTVLAVLMGTFTYAQDNRQHGDRGGSRHHSEFGMKGLVQQLSLTDDQKEQIKEIRNAKTREQIQRQNQVRELRAQLITAMSQDQVDQNQVNGLIDRIGALRISGEKDRAATLIAIREVLTDEQRLIFDQRKSQRKMGHRFHRHRG